MIYAAYTSTPNQSEFKYCILVPSIDRTAIKKEYITPFNIDDQQVVIIDLLKTGKKTPVKLMKEYREELLESIRDMKSEYVIVGDSDYYKLLSDQKKVEANLGYVHKSPYGDFHIIYVPNFRQVFYDPEFIRAKIKLSMDALHDFENNQYIDPGVGIIQSVQYLQSESDIIAALQALWIHKQGVTCDIEAYSLKFYEAGLGTITFCWNQHEGIAFPVDFLPHSKRIREILKDFFIHYPHKLIFHNASYDVTVLIYQLFMEHIEDVVGLLYGLEVFMEKVEDTKIIAYLATNTCAGNTLGLKPLSHEFSGNYAVEDIKDITKIPLEELLQYNVIDGLSTWYVYNKYYPIMVADNQEDVYLNLFKPALVDIIHMQLTGMPLDMDKVSEAKTVMEKDRDTALAKLQSIKYIAAFEYQNKEQWVVAKNQKLKKKRVTVADAPNDPFNPNSDVQLQTLLYEVLDLPVLARTDSGQPSTKGDVLKRLKKHTEDELIHEILDAVIAFKDVIIILNTFITAFEKAIQGPSGQYYLFGFFNLGGTVSGRLSSNDPNLQNIPATGSKYAAIIKECFRTIAGLLFTGYDFASLEDRISALTTKDPNKIKVYTDGYDGHSLRAHFYFGENMPDIDADSVDSINSIADKYKSFRQESKVPTFLLTYGGTWIGIVDKMSWASEKAKLVEKRYHELYVVSDQWVQSKLDQAAIDGYITAAFGLRVRTPLLKQVVRGTRVTPFEAEAEGRTAGNALGQSWGLLNSRAFMAIMAQVRKSKYRLAIRPCAQIHDAGYFIINDDPDAIIYLNTLVQKETKWQDHPDIWHPDVGLGGDLDIYWPSWAHGVTLPEELNHDTLSEVVNKHVNKLKEKGILHDN